MRHGLRGVNSNLVFADNFSGTAGAVPSPPWTQLGTVNVNQGTVGSRAAASSATPGTTAFAHHDVGMSSGMVQAIINTLPGSGQDIAMLLRSVDINNFYMGRIDQAGFFTIYKAIAGTYTMLVQSVSSYCSAGDTIQFSVTSGNVFLLKKVGGSSITVTDATATGTKVGVRIAGGSWSQFRVFR